MKFVRPFLVFLLAWLSAGALYGGATLIAEAHGNPWGFMPLSLLADSPFHSWLIPGIVLLTSNRLLAAWVLWLVLARRAQYGLWAAFQGCVLLGWLTVECILLRVVAWPHYFYGAIGLVIIVLGAAVRHDVRPVEPAS